MDKIDPVNSEMEYTGERMVPERADDETFWEHVYRYRFATSYVAGKDVLDIACGEGYGSAAMVASGAKSVIGVDISETACLHARSRYGLDARVGSAEEIPLATNSVDVVVSFETIEHVPHPERFIDEIARVLRPGGRLVISTPNKEVYADVLVGGANPFHCSELSENEFRVLLSKNFTNQKWYIQRPMRVSRWTPRNFAAKFSVWGKVRGFHRIGYWLRKRWYPQVMGAVAEADRSDPVGLISRRLARRPAFANPYEIFSRRPGSEDTNVYFVVVADYKSVSTGS